MDSKLDAYIAAWNETDADARLSLLEQSWAERGVYQDPTADVIGRDALAQHIAGFHAAMPGARISRSSDVSAHHGNLYFAWQLTDGTGTVTTEGVDFGVIDETGRIKQIVGFFGPPGT